MDSEIKKIDLRNLVLVLLILAVVFSRLVPHMPNFSPFAAVGLFGVAHFQKKWQAFFIPLASIWLSDLIINNFIYGYYFQNLVLFYKGFYWQYGCYFLIMISGLLLLRTVTIKKVFCASLLSSGLFFIITNFGCWLGNRFYTQDLSGLLLCYTVGLPFLKGTLLGDLFYSGVIFGSFYLLEQKYPRLKTVNA
jgi:hypothetical protein